MSNTLQKTDTRTSFWPRFLIGLIVVLVLIGATAFIFGKDFYQKRIVRMLAFQGLQYETLDVDWRGHFEVKNLSAKLFNHASATMASMTGQMSLLGNSTKHEEIKDTVISFPGTKISVARTITENASIEMKQPLSEKEKKTPRLLASMSRINADKQTMSDIVVKQDIAGNNQTITYSNLEYQDIKNGIIGKATIGELTAHVSYDDLMARQSNLAALDMKASSFTVEKINIPFIIDLYMDATTEKDNPYHPVYGAYAMTNLDYTYHTLDGTKPIIEIAKISGSQFSMRLLPFPLTDFITQFVQMNGDKMENNPAQAADFSNKALDILSAIGPLDVTVEGLHASGFQANENFDIDNFTFNYDGTASDTKIRNIKFSDNSTNMDIDSIEANGVQFPQFTATIKEYLAKIANDPTDVTLNNDTAFSTRMGFAFVPHFKAFHINGIKVENINPVNTDTPQNVAIGGIDMTAEYALESIPTGMRIVMRDMGLRAKDFDKGLNESASDIAPFNLTDLGYDIINTTITADMAWNKDTRELKVNELGYKMDDVGSVTFKGTLTNVDATLFSQNLRMNGAAAMAMHANEATVAINFDGVRDRLLNQLTKTSGQDKESLLDNTAMQLSFITGIIIPGDAGKSLSNAGKQFIRNGGTLNITAKAKSEQGLNLYDLILAEKDPMSLLDKIDLKAQTLGGEKVPTSPDSAQ